MVPEQVDVRDSPLALGLDRFGRDPVGPRPPLELRTQAQNVDKRPLHHHAPLRAPPMVRVQVAVDRDAASLGECDGLPDLAPFEVPLLHCS